MEPILSLRGVTKAYSGKTGGVTEVLGGIDLEVEEGEFIAILGFSGAGKTTLISSVAGLVEPDAGEILLRGKPVTGPDKDRGLVFQSYSLFPWLSVEKNVALAVDAVHKDRSREERAALVKQKVELVGLGHAMDRKPSQPRRHAPARGGGTRAGDGAGDTAARRAAFGPRCPDPRQAAGRD
ncbi:MAG: ATP-binding cassette domain-containing protein [Novosphingobium sp.]